ncbi:MAG TPA: hypothetical protein VI796_01425, partial [Candidatus Thermoplasmatota archaeon]|nr:hypothetical protein [Candidatus Thermoplasmatota archaeon]
MAIRAALLLHRGWHRGARRWWWTTAASIAVVLTLVLTVLGAFRGLDAAAQDRVAAFYTGDLRVTASESSAAPYGLFPNGTADPVGDLQRAAGTGAHVSPRLESQFALSRRSLVEAFLEEDTQYTIETPGTVSEDESFYGIGVLVGLGFDDAPALDALRPYLVAGGFPPATDVGDA